MPRKRMNSGEIIFLAIAALLPLVVVMYRWKIESDRRPNMVKAETPWVTCLLPGAVTEERVVAGSGVHYLAAMDSRRMAMLAVVPLNTQSPLLHAIQRNGYGIEEALQTLFATIRLGTRNKVVLKPFQSFQVSGRMTETHEPFSAIVTKLNDLPFATILLVGSDRRTDARDMCHAIAESVDLNREYLQLLAGDSPPEPASPLPLFAP